MLKIGVIGAGHLGKLHLKLLRDIDKFEIAGFYDHNSETAADAQAKLGITRMNSIDELIEKSDVIDIVTPTLSHYDYAVKALKASLHVFIEKPVTNTLAEAKNLIELAKEAGVKVQVGHIERYNPAFIAARQYCSKPMFIETHRLAEFNPRGTDVSVVLDLMIHDIDIILSVVNSTIKKISASGVAVVSDTPDIANARIEFDNGCVANLTASRISLKNMRKSRFFQRDAYITIDFLEKKVSVVKLRNIEPDEKPGPFDIVIDLGEKRGSKQIIFENPPVVDSNALKEELQTFAGAIINNTNPVVTIEDGYNALDVAHKIMNKLRRLQ